MDVDYVSFVFGGLVATGGKCCKYQNTFSYAKIRVFLGSRNNWLRKSTVHAIINCRSSVRRDHMCGRLFELTKVIRPSEQLSPAGHLHCTGGFYGLSIL